LAYLLDEHYEKGYIDSYGGPSDFVSISDYEIENPQDVSLGKCSSSRSRYEDKECKWVRDLLAEGGVTRYKEEYRSKHGPEE
jgi:hypothetical protein